MRGGINYLGGWLEFADTHCVCTLPCLFLRLLFAAVAAACLSLPFLILLLLMAASV